MGVAPGVTQFKSLHKSWFPKNRNSWSCCRGERVQKHSSCLTLTQYILLSVILDSGLCWLPVIPARCPSKIFKIYISSRKVSLGNKNHLFPSLWKDLRAPTKFAALVVQVSHCPKGSNTFSSHQGLKCIWQFFKKHIRDLGESYSLSAWVAAASKCCEFWGFLSRLYTGLRYLLKAAIFMLNCCHDLYFTTCLYTLKNHYLTDKRCFSGSSMKFYAEISLPSCLVFSLVRFGELFALGSYW